ncbi:hypothetical protein Defa_28820 [Desulfovibrio sp. TH_2024_36128]|uniref:Uncharacterized protein n=1 Tax=Desulfovibrio falkowii TaxID=3136602 RepID=A0ABQ0EC75_9BACT
MDKDSMIRSATLKQVKALPETACVSCPNAVWHLILKGKKEELRAFCLLMHALIDEPLTACDGTQIFPKM